jgi:hypothetical protein
MFKLCAYRDVSRTVPRSSVSGPLTPHPRSLLTPFTNTSLISWNLLARPYSLQNQVLRTAHTSLQVKPRGSFFTTSIPE